MTNFLEDDPINDVVDEPLRISANVLCALAAFSAQPKLEFLPGENVGDERRRLTVVLNELAETLVEKIAANPGKLWVMTQFQKSLELVSHEDTEVREHFGAELEEIMDILGIESSDGLLTCYLGAI